MFRRVASFASTPAAADRITIPLAMRAAMGLGLMRADRRRV